MNDQSQADQPARELLTVDGFSGVSEGFFDLTLNDDVQELPGSLNLNPQKVTRVLVTMSSHADGKAFSLPALLDNKSELKFYATGDLIPEQATYLFSCGYEGLVLKTDSLKVYGKEHWLNALQSRLQYPSQRK